MAITYASIPDYPEMEVRLFIEGNWKPNRLDSYEGKKDAIIRSAIKEFKETGRYEIGKHESMSGESEIIAKL